MLNIKYSENQVKINKFNMMFSKKVKVFYK